jgi:protein SCO1
MALDAPTTPPSQQWLADARPPIRLWYGLLLLPILAVLAFAIFQPIQVLPRIGLAPAFAFTDQDGNRMTNEDLRGSLVLYHFTYTGCGEACAPSTVAMQAAQRALAEVETGDIPVKLVTVSFDPERDTPTALRAYADTLGVSTLEWSFVTGDPAQLKNVIGGGFRVYYQQQADGSYAFDPVFALVDGWGILRSVYRTATPDPTLVARDVRLIVQEVENSSGMNRYAYEAAHLFMCYPKY